MASIIALFDKTSVGSITASGTEYWIDLLSYTPDTNSPIPDGKQIWIGYVTVIAQDKGCTAALRPNLPGESLGQDAKTQIRGFTSVPSGESRDIDVYYNGAILSLAPVSTVSTGVEKLWLKIKSNGAASATFEFIIYYTIY